ncbi:tautomerase family protein [Paraburkholderia strydomiana]|uniref:tautomerase family protein n=1 Tax=Paraburkholderia strydomiana TaxID=1245417 RepID=UPI0038BC82FD
MPFVTVKVLEGLLDQDEKERLVTAITDAVTTIKGQEIRPHTWVAIEEFRNGSWGIGGEILKPKAQQS